MAISKKVRFEIFKRDGFTCQYCGRRPPEVVLECDHIDPRAHGGSNDPINLTTACADCNRGKSDKKLGDVQPRPDADLVYLEKQQEIAEAQRYIDASVRLEEVLRDVKWRLGEVWLEYIPSEYAPTQRQWNTWLAQFSPEDIEFAVKRSSGRFQSGKFGTGNTATNNVIRYISGIMNRVREERGSKQ